MKKIIDIYEQEGAPVADQIQYRINTYGINLNTYWNKIIRLILMKSNIE